MPQRCWSRGGGLLFINWKEIFEKSHYNQCTISGIFRDKTMGDNGDNCTSPIIKIEITNLIIQSIGWKHWKLLNVPKVFKIGNKKMCFKPLGKRIIYNVPRYICNTCPKKEWVPRNLWKSILVKRGLWGRGDSSLFILLSYM